MWNPYYGVGSSMCFDSDSTFKYIWRTGLLSGESTGKWYQKNDTLILNSNKQPLQAIYLNQKKRTQEYVSIKVRNYNDSTEVPFIRCKAIFGDSTQNGYTNELGELTFNSTKIDTLKLYSLEFGDRIITTSNDANHFEMWLVETTTYQEPYSYFTNSIWIQKNNMILDDSRKREFHLVKNK